MERRKKYIIDKKIQVSYLISTAVTVFLTSLSVGIAIYCLSFSSLVDQLGPLNLAKSGFKFISRADVVYLIAILLPAFLLSIIIGSFFVIFIHRIVGPLERLRAGFNAVKRGDYSVRLKIRKHDYLHTIMENFNQMVDSLDKK